MVDIADLRYCGPEESCQNLKGFEDHFKNLPKLPDIKPVLEACVFGQRCSWWLLLLLLLIPISIALMCYMRRACQVKASKGCHDNSDTCTPVDQPTYSSTIPLAEREAGVSATCRATQPWDTPNQKGLLHMCMTLLHALVGSVTHLNSERINSPLKKKEILRCLAFMHTVVVSVLCQTQRFRFSFVHLHVCAMWNTHRILHVVSSWLKMHMLSLDCSWKCAQNYITQWAASCPSPNIPKSSIMVLNTEIISTLSCFCTNKFSSTPRV